MKNPFKQIFKRNTLNAEKKEIDISNVPISIIGARSVVNVGTPEQAMRLAAVYRCTDILSSGIASLPLELKTNRKGYFEKDYSDTLYYLLTIRPNGRQNAFDLMRNAVIQMLNAGNAYIYPERNLYGDIESLVLCSPNSVTYDKVTDTYLISDMVNGIFGRFDSWQIIHLKNLSLDGGYTGVSTITYAARVLSISASADEQSLETFKRGNTMKAIISSKDFGDGLLGRAGDEQVESVAKRIQQQFNDGMDFVPVPAEMKLDAISVSPADAQLLETKKFSVLDICRFYGVHPDKVFAGQSNNYKASEMSQVSFLTDTLTPFLKQIEIEFISKLIPLPLVARKLIKFNTETIYQTDLTTKAAYMEKTIQCGVYTVNEWRQKEGQPPVNGGDKAMISANVAPIDSPKATGEMPK